MILNKKRYKLILFIIIFYAIVYHLNPRGTKNHKESHKKHKNGKNGFNHEKTEDKNSTSLSLRTTNHNSNQKTIVLFTYYRSGSTFTGQLLNQHPDIFYLFEPLILGITEADFADKKINLMKQIFKCDLPKFSHFKTDKTPDYVKDSCSRRDFCFPHGTKEFCQPPFCETDFTENRRACSHSPSTVCPGPGELIEEANNVCKKKEFIAIKTIRMTLIQEFIPYFRDDTNGLDPYFIFLVRDPRGLMNSRLRIARVQYHEKDEKKFHEIASKVEGHCKRMVLNVASIENDKFMKQRTIIVRYEDIALDPAKFATKMYRKFGIEMIDEIRNWINQNTHDESRKIDIYSTKRDSSKIANDWRNGRSSRHLNYEFVEDVQKVCSDMMTTFGYIPFSTKEENFDLSLDSMTMQNERQFLFQFR